MRSAALAALVLLTVAGQATRYDIVLSGGTIVDGSGRPGFRADVAIASGRIAAVGRIARDRGVRWMDATGLVVAPGFIDVLTQADDIASHPAASSFVRAGVTTVVGGNLGRSPIEIGDALDRVRDTPIAVNYATLLGQATVRRAVMGDSDRLPSASELARMKALVWKGMADGAIGLSVGRRDPPGSYSTYPELVELARVTANAGGVYATELPRTSTLADAMKEILAIADATGARVEISRAWRGNHGKTADMLQLLSSARQRGSNVLADTDVYGGSGRAVGNADPDLDRLIVSRDVVIASNGASAADDERLSRGPYDNPARLLGRSVRERHLLSLEAAVRKMSGLPAEQYRIGNRGVVRAGAWADLVVFDAKTIGAANASAVGQAIRAVFVNGAAVVRDGVETSGRPGHVLATSLLERR